MFGISGSYSQTDQLAQGPLSVVGGGRGVSPWLIAGIVIAAALVLIVWLKGKR